MNCLLKIIVVLDEVMNLLNVYCTMMCVCVCVYSIAYRNNALISNSGGGFRWQNEIFGAL